MNPVEIVVQLIVLNGRELVGRTRLQKTAYLLDRCGADFGLQYTYHHYGPYSFDLAGACAYAAANRHIETVERISGYYGVPFAIFKASDEATIPDRLGRLPADKAVYCLDAMKKVSDTVLELAATIIFLRDEWDYFDKSRIGPIDELKRRKSLKASEERIDRAKRLLSELELWE